MGGDKTIIGGVTDVAQPGLLPHDLFVSLSVIEGPDTGANFNITKTHTVVGRGECDIRFNDQTVSGRHASFEYVGTDFMLIDMGSSNGTTVNGERIEKAKVKNMDEIQFGGTKVFLSVVKDVYGTFSQQAGGPMLIQQHVVDPNAITAPRKAVPNPALDKELKIMLFVIEGPDAGGKYMITTRSTILGRADYTDFPIHDEAVSRRHCQVLVRDKDFMGLKDLASTNATYLNDRLINAVQLAHNDIIKIGDTKIKFIIM